MILHIGAVLGLLSLDFFHTAHLNTFCYIYINPFSQAVVLGWSFGIPSMISTVMSRNCSSSYCIQSLVDCCRQTPAVSSIIEQIYTMGCVFRSGRLQQASIQKAAHVLEPSWSPATPRQRGSHKECQPEITAYVTQQAPHWWFLHFESI